MASNKYLMGQELLNRLAAKGPTKEMWLLVGGPVIFLLVIITILTIIIFFKKRKDKKDLQEAILFSDKDFEPKKSDQPKPINLLGKLKQGLSKTRNNLIDNLSSLISKHKSLNDDLLEQLHEALYKADLGVKTVDRLLSYLKTKLSSSSDIEWTEVQTYLKEEIVNIFSTCNKPLNKSKSGPWVILIVGVNGVGKTTTISKLAASFLAQKKSVLLCAADTYRAAAIDQLQVWGKRLNIDVIAHKQGSDPASVAFDAVKVAKSRNTDILFIDTAGRLHNKKELMDELNKIKRVLGKVLPEAPHETWLVIDATTGQNATMQVKAFKEVVDVSGLIVTKLDGTAKGGVIIGIADKFKIPFRYIGVGEKPEDLQEFNAENFAESIFS